VTKGLWETFGEIPLLLRIACAASFFLGVFQVIAIILPSASPQIGGASLTNPVLMLVMGVAHIALGWGIFARKKLVMPFLAILPLFQYGVLYLDMGLPDKDAIYTNLGMSFGWLLFFGLYFLSSSVRRYFDFGAGKYA